MWRGEKGRATRAAWWSAFAILSAAYFYGAIRMSWSRYLWLDDILAVTAAGQHSWADVWSALWAGTDFCPPAYHYLLHALARATGIWDSPLLWRLPSIAAVYGTGLCALVLALRYLSPWVALVVFGLILNSDLFIYALQVRSYAVLALAYAGALLVWDGYARSRRPRARALGLWLLGALCVSLHFYGFIPVVGLGVAELLWLLSRGEIRWGIWTALVLTIPVQLAWTPLALHLATFNAQASSSPAFYGHPSMEHFREALVKMLQGGSEGQSLFFISCAVLAAVFVVRELTGRRGAHDDAVSPRPDPFSLESPFVIIILATFTLPFLTFVFSFLVTKNFSDHYAICGALDFGFAYGYVLHRVPFRSIVAPVLVGVLVAFFFLRLNHKPDLVASALEPLKAPLREPLPIVIENGRDFVELNRAGSEALRNSLVFLLNEPDFKSPDPTNELIVKRLAPYLTGGQVFDRDAFLQTHPRFYVMFTTEHTISGYMPWLVQGGYTLTLERESGGELIFLVSQNR